MRSVRQVTVLKIVSVRQQNGSRHQRHISL